MQVTLAESRGYFTIFLSLRLCSACFEGWLERCYGVRSRRTRLLEDQLGRADAGSWQIADGGATRKAAAGGTSVGDLRVHFVVEL